MSGGGGGGRGGGGGGPESGGGGGGGKAEGVDGAGLLNNLTSLFLSSSSISVLLQNLCSTSIGMKEASVPTLWTGLDSTNPRWA